MPRMHLDLVGATGRVGGRVLEYALAEGRTVTALVRDAGMVRVLSVAGGGIVDSPNGGRRISVEDVADFLLGELAARAHLRKRVGLGY
jgi:putative NADH-flavin reductase